jgi:hypothetical protein
MLGGLRCRPVGLARGLDRVVAAPHMVFVTGLLLPCLYTPNHHVTESPPLEGIASEARQKAPSLIEYWGN